MPLLRVIHIMQNVKLPLWMLLCYGLNAAAQTDSTEKQKKFTKNADAYTVEFMPFNSNTSDFSGCYFRDAIVFSSTREKPWFNKKADNGENYAHLYTTQKNARGKYLKPKPFMGDLTTKYNDGPVSFTSDFSAVYFARINQKKSKRAADGNYKMQMFMATLNQNGFDSVAVMPFNNSEYNVAHPAISPDGQLLFFTSDRPGGKGGMDIYMCRKEQGNWSAPVNLGDKVNTASDDAFPFVSADNKLYFSTSGLDGMGGMDVYEAFLKNGQVTKVYNMGAPVNSEKDDFGFYLGSDLKTGFVSSNRREGETGDDIYEVHVLREVKRGKTVKLQVSNENHQPLPRTLVLVNSTDSLYTDSTGSCEKELEDGRMYEMRFLRSDCFEFSITLSGENSTDDVFTKKIQMTTDPKLRLVAQVRDLKTGLLLDGVSLRITDSSSGKVLPDLAFADGDYSLRLNDKKIGDRVVYTLQIDKPGYLSKTVTLRHTLATPGDVRLHELTDLSIGKAEVGMDLAKMIDLQPIYFDLGKAAIRKDAALELDKIVAIMNRYPNMSIELGSHTDCRSGAAANLKLSTARAKASAAYIVKKGIAKTRITGKGYGESKLLNNCACEGKTQSNCSEEEHTKNRRTEFIITRMQ